MNLLIATLNAWFNETVLSLLVALAIWTTCRVALCCLRQKLVSWVLLCSESTPKALWKVFKLVGVLILFTVRGLNLCSVFVLINVSVCNRRQARIPRGSSEEVPEPRFQVPLQWQNAGSDPQSQLPNHQTCSLLWALGQQTLQHVPQLRWRWGAGGGCVYSLATGAIKVEMLSTWSPVFVACTI